MKISKQQLQGIIKEELNRLLSESEKGEYFRNVDGPARTKSRETSTSGPDPRAGGFGSVHSVSAKPHHTGASAVQSIKAKLVGKGDPDYPMSEQEAEDEAWSIINMFKKIAGNIGFEEAKKSMIKRVKDKEDQYEGVPEILMAIPDERRLTI